MATKLMSTKQASFLGKLIQEHASLTLSPGATAIIDAVKRGDAVSVREASLAIDAFLFAARQHARQYAQTQPRQDAEPGYYVTPDKTYIVVVPNRAGTHTYAKRLVINDNRARWDYAPGLGHKIASDGMVPVTLAEAAAWGHMHGICFVCCRQLTDPQSVADGIGPVCKKRIVK